MQADVVIAGGGIGGAVLAGIAWARRQARVVLRSTAPPKWLRPEILWPATIEVLFSLAPQQGLGTVGHAVTAERSAFTTARSLFNW
jgi:2-polyprenyl-6-methoxyphenol hydroxylase-like FAD-dependent oxidoreductase